MRLSILLILCTFCTFATSAERQKEKQLVGGKNISITTRQELTFKARADADVKTRELWYRRLSNNNWANWEKHPNDFGPKTDITWAPPEGHWQIYIRIIEISGNALAQPSANTKADVEFIVDRTAPSVAVVTPKNGEILRTEQPYTITWEASDPNLHSAGIDLYWSQTGSSEEILIAANLPNTGSYDWITPNKLANEARVIVKATDKVLNSAAAQSANIIIDGAPPHRSILGPQTSMARAVALETRAFDVGPAKKISEMQLWYSADNGVNWSQGPSINGPDFNQLNWTAPADGEYQLSLVTSDIAGNKNAIPTSRHDSLATLLVDTVKPAIQLGNAIGVQEPGVGSDSSRRTFKPEDKVVISWTIQDMQLAEKPVSVYFRNAPDAPWELIKSGLESDSSLSYALPNINSRQCRVKVEAVDACGNLGSTTSSEDFTIDNKVEATDVTVEFD